jgi:hypothetical protein
MIRKREVSSAAVLIVETRQIGVPSLVAADCMTDVR